MAYTERGVSGVAAVRISGRTRFETCLISSVDPYDERSIGGEDFVFPAWLSGIRPISPS